MVASDRILWSQVTAMPSQHLLFILFLFSSEVAQQRARCLSRREVLPRSARRWPQCCGPRALWRSFGSMPRLGIYKGNRGMAFWGEKLWDGIWLVFCQWWRNKCGWAWGRVEWNSMLGRLRWFVFLLLDRRSENMLQNVASGFTQVGSWRNQQFHVPLPKDASAHVNDSNMTLTYIDYEIRPASQPEIIFTTTYFPLFYIVLHGLLFLQCLSFFPRKKKSLRRDQLSSTQRKWLLL